MSEKAKEETIYAVPALREFEQLYEILDQRVGPSQRSGKEDLVRMAQWVPTAYVGLTNFFTPEYIAMADQYISEIIGVNPNLNAESLIILVACASGVMASKGMSGLGNMTGLGTERNKRLRECYSGMLSDMKVVDKGLKELSPDEKTKQRKELQLIYGQITADYQAFLDVKTNEVPVAIREKSVSKVGLIDELKATKRYSGGTPRVVPRDIGGYQLYYVPLKRPKDLK
jgi:hypothetical protein